MNGPSGFGADAPGGNPFSNIFGSPGSPGGLISLSRGLGLAPPGGGGARAEPSILEQFMQMTAEPETQAETPDATPASEPPATRAGAQVSVDPQIVQGIRETAEAVGIDPVDLATAISYETGGTFDPTKRGPTTKWGQHRGLIQFGEPQARQHGVDWANPVASQLGRDGAVASYLRASGVKPGMSLLDVYSAINAGAPGLYDRSDTAAGGAPGTVRDKVEKQMAGHRRKAEQLFGASRSQPRMASAATLGRQRQSGTQLADTPPAQAPEAPAPPPPDPRDIPFQIVADDIEARGTTESLRDLSPGATLGVIREIGRRARAIGKPI